MKGRPFLNKWDEINLLELIELDQFEDVSGNRSHEIWETQSMTHLFSKGHRFRFCEKANPLRAVLGSLEIVSARFF